jgi:hypothetical protein
VCRSVGGKAGKVVWTLKGRNPEESGRVDICGEGGKSLLLAIVTRTDGPTSKERNDYVRLRLDRGGVPANNASKL